VTPQRKGFSRRSDIPSDVLHELNTGVIPSRTLAETLAIDFRILFASVVPDLDPAIAAQLDPQIGIMKRMMLGGELLAAHRNAAAIRALEAHPSDIVRSWLAFAHGRSPRATPATLLKRLQPLADDSHFGVRECAWMAFRPMVAKDVPRAIDLLLPWTSSASPNLRRFASEVTRPRGVWCSHLEVLKKSPELGLPLLEPLRADETKYVQDSVANWLNDASKSQPTWVKDVCRRWKRESRTKATERICQRGMRSL
jgi:3-methyladenine DNA glycosylase AlkC